MRMRNVILVLAMFCSAEAALAEIRLQGELTQGALIRGEVEPGSRVWLNDRPLRVTESGSFVFGIGRDGELTQELRVKKPDGTVETQQVSLKKREYNVQRINGVAQKHVDPDPEQLKRIQAESRLTRNARARDLERTDFLQDFIWPAT